MFVDVSSGIALGRPRAAHPTAAYPCSERASMCERPLCTGRHPFRPSAANERALRPVVGLPFVLDRSQLM